MHVVQVVTQLGFYKDYLLPRHCIGIIKHLKYQNIFDFMINETKKLDDWESLFPKNIPNHPPLSFFLVVYCA